MTEVQTILLVDDSENDVELMRLAFQRAQFNNPMHAVYNGEEAIAYLKGEGAYSDRKRHPLPAVILLDLNMPMRSGFDVLAWLSTRPTLKRIPVIILTASTRAEEVKQAFDLGAHSFLVKPPRMEELISMVRCLRDWLRLNHFPALHEEMERAEPLSARTR
jgi:CheY-like chemotaxis protein